MPLEQFDACNKQRIEEFLSGTIGSVEEDTLIRHVERCGECRQMMDRCAAADETWDSARRVFGR